MEDTILLQKNIDAKIYPASLSKMITAIVAIENLPDLKEEIKLNNAMFEAVFLNYALQNDVFREIFTSSVYSIQQTNKHPDGVTFSSTMFEKLKKSKQDITGGEILGGKTGYTDEAGLCLASLAMVDEQEYVLITSGAEGNQYTEQYNITDALTAYSSISR